MLVCIEHITTSINKVPNIFLITTLRALLLSSLMADLCQDIKSFS